MAVDNIWVFAQGAGDALTTGTLELLTKARSLGSTSPRSSVATQHRSPARSAQPARRRRTRRATSPASSTARQWPARCRR